MCSARFRKKAITAVVSPVRLTLLRDRRLRLINETPACSSTESSMGRQWQRSDWSEGEKRKSEVRGRESRSTEWSWERFGIARDRGSKLHPDCGYSNAVDFGKNRPWQRMLLTK